MKQHKENNKDMLLSMYDITLKKNQKQKQTQTPNLKPPPGTSHN